MPTKLVTRTLLKKHPVLQNPAFNSSSQSSHRMVSLPFLISCEFISFVETNSHSELQVQGSLGNIHFSFQDCNTGRYCSKRMLRVTLSTNSSYSASPVRATWCLSFKDSSITSKYSQWIQVWHQHHCQKVSIIYKFSGHNFLIEV